MTDSNDENTTKGRRDMAGAEQLRRAKRVARTLLDVDIQGLSIENLPGDIVKSGEQTASSPAQAGSPLLAPKPSDKRRVAKTLIDADVQNKGMPSPHELPPAPSEKPKRAVSKTKLFSDLPEFEGSAKGASKRRLSQQFVARTLIDHKLIIEMRSQFDAKEKQLLEQKISEHSLKPRKIIEPIDAQRKVRECQFSWKTDESSTERFKHCTKCQATIYNFEGLALPEAEALIFKRENRKNFVLYKRGDGKFMTSDCPISKRQRHQLFGLVAVCFCVIVCIGEFLIMMPPPPPPTFDKPPDAVTTHQKTRQQSRQATSPVLNGGRSSFHYEAGMPTPTITKDDSSKSSSNSQTHQPFSDSEQKGEFWQFPNGQPADRYTPDSSATSHN